MLDNNSGFVSLTSYNYLKINKINSLFVPDLLSLLKFKDNKVGKNIIVNDSSYKN